MCQAGLIQQDIALLQALHPKMCSLCPTAKHRGICMHFTNAATQPPGSHQHLVHHSAQKSTTPKACLWLQCLALSVKVLRRAANSRMQACRPCLARAYCAARKRILLSVTALEQPPQQSMMTSGTTKGGAGPTHKRSVYSKVCCPRADKHNTVRAGRCWGTLRRSTT